MKTISLTPGAAMRLCEMARPLATKAAEFLTSPRLSTALGGMALAAILWTQATGTHAAMAAALTLAWALQGAATAATFISEKGGEL